MNREDGGRFLAKSNLEGDSSTKVLGKRCSSQARLKIILREGVGEGEGSLISRGTSTSIWSHLHLWLLSIQGTSDVIQQLILLKDQIWRSYSNFSMLDFNDNELTGAILLSGGKKSHDRHNSDRIWQYYSLESRHHALELFSWKHAFSSVPKQHWILGCLDCRLSWGPIATFSPVCGVRLLHPVLLEERIHYSFIAVTL